MHKEIFTASIRSYEAMSSLPTETLNSPRLYWITQSSFRPKNVYNYLLRYISEEICYSNQIKV